MVLRSKQDIPDWAKSLEGLGLFEDAQKYGFRSMPQWEMSEPGLEAGWRKRSSPSRDEADSMRLVYRTLAGKLQLRLGQETNPWAISNGIEQVTLGERNFVELGLPLSRKFAGQVRMSRLQGFNTNGQGFFVSLRGKLSEVDKLELFCAIDPPVSAERSVDT